MGIFDSIKESAKKAIDVAKENYQRSQVIKSWKEAVVVTLTFPQICSRAPYRCPALS